MGLTRAEDGPRGPCTRPDRAPILGEAPPHGPPTMIESEIQAMLDAPATGRESPTLASIEDMLTSGYARAMAVEAERWRLERRLAELAGTPSAGIDNDAELRRVGAELKSADTDLVALRALLAELRKRADAARATAA
jgi:hypothetical protein